LITLSTTAQNKPLNFHVLTAISIGDKRFWPPVLPAIKGFERCFCRRSMVWGAVYFAGLSFESCFYRNAYRLSGVTGNGNMDIKREWLNYLTNLCPVPPTHTNTYWLIRLPTPLLSHRTLPVSYWNICIFAFLALLSTFANKY
jgi:hypothetical protein